jgi:hypothetical protein
VVANAGVGAQDVRAADAALSQLVVERAARPLEGSSNARELTKEDGCAEVVAT